MKSRPFQSLCYGLLRVKSQENYRHSQPFSVQHVPFFLLLPSRRQRAISGTSSRLLGIQTIYANNGSSRLRDQFREYSGILEIHAMLSLSFSQVGDVSPVSPHSFFFPRSRPLFAVSQLPVRPLAQCQLRKESKLVLRLFNYVGDRSFGRVGEQRSGEKYGFKSPR